MLSRISGDYLPPLLWHPRKDDPDGGFRPERFNAPAAPSPTAAHTKPRGGLWTSAMARHRGLHRSAFEMRHGRGGSAKSWAWVTPPSRVYALGDARLMLVDSAACAELLYTRYGRRARPSALPPDIVSMLHREREVDWAAVADEADAVVLTDRGLAQLNTGWTCFAAWDVPTVFWLNQAFWVKPPDGPSPRIGRTLSRGV